VDRLWQQEESTDRVGEPFFELSGLPAALDDELPVSF
jgi:hypothetical protein